MPDSVFSAVARVVLRHDPVLLFGGPYSNFEATQALLAEAARRKIPSENIICTGDIVAYCADAKATVALLKSQKIAVVMGNCEEQLAAGAEDCGCGFTAGTTCDVLSEQWYSYAAAQLDDTARQWMRDLPRSITLELAGYKLKIIHGAVSEISRFIFSSTAAAVLREEISLAGCDGVIGGHCGLPFTRLVDNKLWHNPGVIGMPANDGTARGWYSILTPKDRTLEISHHTLAYDHQAAARKMRAEPLPSGYADCLENGLWPSLDVLPPLEQQQTGEALDLSRPITLAH